MAKAKKAVAAAAGAESASSASTAGATGVITWSRLPKGVEIKAVGPKSARLDKLLKNAKMVPRDPCFGGDTCIV